MWEGLNMKEVYGTIRKLGATSKYKGYYCGNKTRVIDFMSKQRVYLGEDEIVQYKAKEDIVPQIVDDKLWQRCNEILKERSEKAKSETSGYNNKYKFSGKIFCKEDGQAYWRTITRGKEFWQCALYKKHGKDGCTNNVNIYTETLDEIMKKIFNELFINKEKFIENLLDKCMEIINDDSSEKDIQIIEDKIENIKREKKKLIKLYTSELITESEFEEENKIYNEKLNKLNNEYKNMKKTRDATSNDETREILKKSFEKDLNFNLGVPDQILDRMLDRINVKKEDDIGLANLEIILKIDLKVNLLYKKKKFFKYIENSEIAS